MLSLFSPAQTACCCCFCPSVFFAVSCGVAAAVAIAAVAIAAVAIAAVAVVWDVNLATVKVTGGGF